ncbi:MAG: hypothetical protein Ta2E_06310 [Mycoplasmoidaceae bacterium]|nr:MAG: hypothetical protein Ta2E_06310 [Mycoplasmoidaceae bacterium]
MNSERRNFMTRKTKSWFCVLSGILGTVAATIIGISIMQSKKINTKSSNVDKYGKNFQRWNIHSKFNQKKLDNFVKLSDDQNQYRYVIDENNFSQKMNELARDTLASENRFKANSNSYILYVNYLFTDDTNVAVELIWTLTDNEYVNNTNDLFFYDQFELFMYN